MTERVLVPFDGSAAAERALAYACEEFPDADLVVLAVADPMAYYSRDTFKIESGAWRDGLLQDAARKVERAEQLAGDLGRAIERHTTVGRPGRQITTFATENDIHRIVMGPHGRRGVDRLLVGSVTRYVVRHAPVPVTIVR